MDVNIYKGKPTLDSSSAIFILAPLGLAVFQIVMIDKGMTDIDVYEKGKIGNVSNLKEMLPLYTGVGIGAAALPRILNRYVFNTVEQQNMLLRIIMMIIFLCCVFATRGFLRFYYMKVYAGEWKADFARMDDEISHMYQQHRSERKMGEE